MEKQTAIQEMIDDLDCEFKERGISVNWEIYLEKEKQEMLEFGSRVAERWGLTSVEPHYIEDEYNKVYKGFSAE
jgi:hypothetical protein